MARCACVRQQIWDAIEYFKIPVLPNLIGVDARFQKVKELLEERVRKPAESEVLNEDHDEHVTHELHKLYKEYKIQPHWPKSIKRRTIKADL